MKFIQLRESIPNIGITLNNKLVELSNIFKEKGLSLYVGEYGDNKKEVCSSFIGSAIIFDLISYAKEGSDSLKNYSEYYQEMTERKIKRLNQITKRNSIKIFLMSALGKDYKKMCKTELEYSEDEIKEISLFFSIYRNIDKELFNYNLDDDIVETVGNYIYDKGYSGYSTSEIIEKYVSSDFKKLGLEEKTDELYRYLIKKFKYGIEHDEVDKTCSKIEKNQRFVKKVNINYNEINKEQTVIKSKEENEEIR